MAQCKKKPTVDLSKLPLWIVKVNSKWYKNTRTKAYIKKEHLANHLPKEETQTEVKPTWHSSYDNY
jgi:hypothetical protein